MQVKRAKQRICLVFAMMPERQYKMRGDVLLARMKEKTLSVAALADQVDVNVATISRWIKGSKAYLRNIRALADVLDLPPSQLANGIPPSSPDLIEVKILITITQETLQLIKLNPAEFTQRLRQALATTDHIGIISPHPERSGGVFITEGGSVISRTRLAQWSLVLARKWRCIIQALHNQIFEPELKTEAILRMTRRCHETFIKAIQSGQANDLGVLESKGTL